MWRCATRPAIGAVTDPCDRPAPELAAAPWAAHHLGSTADTGHQAATTTVGRLVQAHTGLITAHHDAERANAEQIERYRRQERTRARDRSRGRDDGYDLSL